MVCLSLRDEPSSGQTAAARVRVNVINSLNALMRALMRIMLSSRLATPCAACRGCSWRGPTGLSKQSGMIHI